MKVESDSSSEGEGSGDENLEHEKNEILLFRIK